MEGKIFEFGIVGCGGIAEWYGKAIKEMENVSIVAAADIIPEKLENFVNNFNISHKFTDYVDMFKNVEIDACIIATPVFVHEIVAKDAARTGINVLCEKPIGRNLKETRNIINTCKENNILFSYMTNWRYSSIIREIKNIIRKEEIGKIVNIVVNFASPGPEIVMPNIGDWIFDKEKAGGGVILDLGYHAIDILKYIFGKPETIYGKIDTLVKKADVEDNAIITIGYHEGIIGLLRLSWTEIVKMEGFDFGPRIQIFGTCGNIKANLLQKTIQLTKMDQNIYSKQIDNPKFSKEPMYHGHKEKIVEFVGEVREGKSINNDYLNELMSIPIMIDLIYKSASLKKEMVV